MAWCRCCVEEGVHDNIIINGHVNKTFSHTSSPVLAHFGCKYSWCNMWSKLACEDENFAIVPVEMAVTAASQFENLLWYEAYSNPWIGFDLATTVLWFIVTYCKLIFTIQAHRELNQNIFIFLALLILYAASRDEVATGGYDLGGSIQLILTQ